LRCKKKILVVLIMIAIPALSWCQDVHFSQYFNNPLGLNPSQTGDFEGNWRIVGNFRNQWQVFPAPFRTFSGSVDKQVKMNKDNLGVGLYVLNDQSGNVNLTSNNIYLSAAYFKEIHHHIFSTGLQIGYVVKQINSFTFPQDYSTTSYAFESMQPGESLSYFDVNLGAGWKHRINDMTPEVGVSAFHLNHPKESFSDENSRLPIRLAVHTSVRFDLTGTFYLKPSILVSSMTSAKDIMFGCMAASALQGNRYNVREINGGFYLRNGITNTIDAAVAMFGVQVNNLNITLSYDYNISTLNTVTNHRGAFELSFVYKSINSILKTFSIPCDRI